MFRIVELTLSIKLAVGMEQSRDVFLRNLQSTIRSAFSETIACDSDAVRVVGAIDPDQIVDLPLDMDSVLARSERMAVIWSVDDVNKIRPDLTRQQSLLVLQRAKQLHDVRFGINWDTLDYAAEQLFGEAPEPAESANG